LDFTQTYAQGDFLLKFNFAKPVAIKSNSYVVLGSTISGQCPDATKSEGLSVITLVYPGCINLASSNSKSFYNYCNETVFIGGECANQCPCSLSPITPNPLQGCDARGTYYACYIGPTTSQAALGAVAGPILVLAALFFALL
jgi:hypothetical protein